MANRERRNGLVHYVNKDAKGSRRSLSNIDKNSRTYRRLLKKRKKNV